MRSWDRAASALVPLAAAVFLFAASNQIAQSVYNDPNWGRLQKTFVLADRLPLYYGQFSGPALTTAYGPVSVIGYLPATLFQEPGTVMRLASALAALYFFLPAAFFFKPGSGLSRGPAAISLIAFGYFSFILYSLKNAAFNVHVDAPTIGLLALAAAFLYFYRDGEKTSVLVLSAVSVSLAVWSKLVALPALAALPLYAGLAYGRKTFFRYLVILGASLAAVSAAVFAAFGTENLFFNLFTVLSRHPLKDGGAAGAFLKFADKMLREYVMLGPMLVPAFVLARKYGDFRRLAAARWALPLLLAVFLLPTAFLGFAKVGGSRNNLAYVNYFVLLAALSAWAELWRDPGLGPLAKKTAVALVAALAAGQAAYAFSDFFLVPPRPDRAKAAYEYVRSHPGEAYFPTLTLVHRLAEGKFYHEAVALCDREIAGLGAGPEHLAAYMPAAMKIIAFPEGSDYMGWLHAPGFGPRSEDPDLPGFWVYRKT